MSYRTEDEYQRVKWNGWGNKDKVMRVDEEEPLRVRHHSGKVIKNIVPFIKEEILGKDVVLNKLDNTPSISMQEAIQKLAPPIVNAQFLHQVQKSGGTSGAALRADQIKTDGESRVTHIFGKNYRDLWRIRQGLIARAPDAVILPESHDNCVAIMEAAHKHNVVIIPYGGGTNVTGCIEPNPEEKLRMIVSVDMRRMNKMLSISTESSTAVFETGVLGPDLDEQLGRHGFLLGHDPDSYVFSTLGGWIGARSSGAYSNKYGDIEDMVLSLKIATPTGVIETPVQSRPNGPDLNAMFIGSEGVFGIITEATIRVFKVPPKRYYAGYLFPSWEAGFSAFYKITQDDIQPCCLRLYDADETRISFALKTEPSPLMKMVSNGIKKYLEYGQQWNMENVCLCIFGLEGTPETVASQKAQVEAVFAKHDGFSLGQGAGSNWQEKKYDLPYFRDFALNHKFWADVLETTVNYSDALALHRSVKEAVREVWRKEGKSGWIGCHTAHQYTSGCCLYFTFASQQYDENDIGGTFLKLKRAATEAILKCNGNLTHHHGIGFEHVPWMPRLFPKNTLDLMLKFKNELDPKGVCNPGKLLPVARNPGESDEELAARRARVQMFDKVGVPRSKL